MRPRLVGVILFIAVVGCSRKRVPADGDVDNPPKSKASSPAATPTGAAPTANPRPEPTDNTSSSPAVSSTKSSTDTGLAARPGCDPVEQPADTCDAVRRLLGAMDVGFKGMRCEVSPDLVGKGKVKIGEVGELALTLADFRPAHDARLEYKTYGVCRFAVSTEPKVSPVDVRFTCDYTFKFDERVAEFARQFKLIDRCLGAAWTHDNDGASQRSCNTTWETKSKSDRKRRCTLKSDDSEPAAGTLSSGSIVFSCGREWPEDLPADAGVAADDASSVPDAALKELGSDTAVSGG